MNSGQMNPMTNPMMKSMNSMPPPPSEFEFEVISESLGSMKITLSPQSSAKTLYESVRGHFRTQDFYLRTVDTKSRLPDNAHPLSQYLPPPEQQSKVQLAFVTTNIDDVVTLQYMCEKCGHTFYRAVNDEIECPLQQCKHGILLKCRRPNVETTYDTI